MNEDLTLREARAEDVPGLAALYGASVRSFGPEHYEANAVEAWAAFARSDRFRDFVMGSRTLVVEDEEGIVGFGGIDASGRIASLYVRPDRSRQGVGSTLLSALLELGRADGLREFRAEASELGKRLFEKFGFSVVGTEVVERAGVRIERYRMARAEGFALVLRPWAESDALGLREAIDEDVGHLRPWLSWTLVEPATLERTRSRLRRWVGQHRRGAGFRWAIAPADRPSRILGGASLNFRAGPSAHDIGYWVRKSAARQGIATAAVSRLVAHAFETRGVDRLVSQCDVDNAASAAFARALGFELAGEATTRYPDGAPRPVYRFVMTGERYRLRHAPTVRDRARRVRLVTEPMDFS